MSQHRGKPPPSSTDVIPTLKRLFGLMRPERGWMAAGAVMAVLSTLAGIGLLAASGHFITSMALVGAGGAAINYYTPAALIRLFAILRTGGRYVERLITHEATLGTLGSLRVWLFGRLVPLAPAGLGELRSAELFSRLRADVDALEHAYLGTLVPLVTAMVVAVVAVITVLLFLPALSLPLILLLATAGALLPLWTLARGQVPGAATVTLAEELRSLASDGLRGRAELALYGAELAHAERLAATTHAQQWSQRQLDGLRAKSSAGVMLCAQLAGVCALTLGIPALRTGRLAAPDLTMLVLFAGAVFEAMAPLPEAWAQLGATLASARRVFALADTAPPVVEPPTTISSPVVKDNTLKIRGLRMRYGRHGPWALNGVDLDLRQGSRLALVGPSGAGKSSLIGALARLYPYEGEITLGGTSLDTWHGDDVRAHIAVVEQHPYLFDASLRDNLRIACPEASDEALASAVTQSQLDGYVASLPHGLDTWVGENGVRISGGEARRIAIARALLADAPILLLDEPTEGLDAGTAAEFYGALAVAMSGRSVLLITHRLGGLSTLVDEVAVMQQGRVVERLPVADYLERKGAMETDGVMQK